MPLFRGFINAIAPQIDNTEKALQEGVQNITFAKPIRRNSELPQRRQISRVQTQTEQTLRVDTPPPPIPERNQARPGYTLRIRDIRQEHQRRRQQEHQRPEVTCLDTPKPQPEQQNRQLTLTDAELSKFLRKTRPGFPRQRASPNKSEDTMAGTRPQRITSHQIFLNDQVKTQQDATDAWALQTGKPTPPYQFEDFIGKGAYGRVFRAVHKTSQQQFAIKVMDVDAVDYQASAKFRDDSIREFMHETKVLQKLAGAPNVNQIFDIMEVEAQFWIISEYVPGGSVKNLMQSTGGKLDESYILVIAREIAKGLRAIHDSGIIHRDLKAANIMVHEEGRVQIIDFGVAGLMETKTDRRGTIIGTFNWMAPEVLKYAKGELGDDRQAPDGASFGIEIDVWSYGCTLYEMAKGKPPNAGAQNARQIERMIKSMRPRLKPEDGFSHGLCDLVAYVLQLEPEKRPSMDNVLQHPWIYDTEETHPTATLRELIRVYEGWASSGGQRQSLIQEHGAAAAKFPEDPKDFEDWRFSVVSIGEAYYDNVDNLARATDPTMDLEMAQREENNLNSLIPESSYTPNDSPTHGVTMKTTASEESRIQGVGAKFAQFFQGEGYSGSEAMPQVEPNRPRSDLLLRNDTSESDASQKENNRKKTNFRGTPVDTTRANQTGKPVEQAVDRDARRGTLLQNWDFGQASRPIQEPNHEYQQMPNISPDWIQSHRVQNHSFEDLGAPGDDVEVAEHSYALPSRPALHHYATAPVEPPMLRSSIDTATSRQTLDLDALMNEGSYDYNPPSSSQPYGYNAPSPQQYNAPAAYQPYANTAGASASMMDAQDFSYNAPSPRNDYHIDAISPTTVAGPQDDQSQYATMTARSTITNGSSAYDLTERARGTTNGRTHTPTDSIYGPTYDDITRPSPPSAAAMASDAPAEIIGGELERLALDYQQVLHSAAGLWEDESFGEEDADDGEDEEGNHNAGLDDH